MISQVQEFQLILHEIETEGMILPDFSGCYYCGETLTCVERFQELPKAQTYGAEVGIFHYEA